MKLKYFVILVTLLLNSSLFTLRSLAEGIGEWKLYPSFSSITQIVPAGDKVYVLSNSNIYSYSVKEESYETINKSNGLSDINVTHIAWSQSAKALILVYDNSNIDLLYSDGEIVNVPDLYNKTLSGGKTINNIYIYGKYAYLCGEFGIMKVDMKEGYICDTYNLHININAVTLVDNNIYALTDNSILTIKTTDNLADKNLWTTLKDLESDGWKNLYYLNGNLLVGKRGNINYLNLSTLKYDDYAALLYTWISMNNDQLVCGSVNWMYIADSKLNLFSYLNMDFTCTYMVYDKTNNCYWGNNDNGALTKYEVGETTVTAKSTGIKPEGPASNYCYHLGLADGKLLVTAGGWSSVIGNFALNGQILQFENDKWTEFESTGDIVSAVGRYQDVNSVAIDPRNSNHVFASCYNGLYEFMDGKFKKRWGYDDGLQLYDGNTAKLHHVITTDLKYDSSNNLWIGNGLVPTPLYCLTSDGTLKNIDVISQTNTAYSEDIEGITFDGDYIWFVNQKPHYPVLYRYNKSTNTASSCMDFANQDNSSLGIIYLHCTTLDKKGNLWIGTDMGPFYITSDDKDSFVFTQYKVPRNDGTDLADYLLKDIDVYDIEVDGANRKWIGTASDGIYVISSDCNTQLYHFTSSNSALPSDCIYDILIDSSTGRVYFATSNGICSYKSDATEGNEEVESDDVYAYPNPVTPDFTGNITIVGLAADSDVKITTASGELVNTGTSNGGTYTWNGRNQNGDKVASGVYMVCAATSDGNSGVVTKIAIIR